MEIFLSFLPFQQYKGSCRGQEKRQHYWEPRVGNGQIYGIYAVECKNDIGYLKDNGHNGQPPHNEVKVVGYDRGEAVHHTGKDAGVDTGHLDSLLHLDENVLKEVLILVVELYDSAAEYLLDSRLIGFQRCGKVYQRLLKGKELHEELVLHGVVELLLCRR